jgi:hypothetical protein
MKSSWTVIDKLKLPYYIRGTIEFHIRIDIRTSCRISDDESLSEA